MKAPIQWLPVRAQRRKPDDDLWARHLSQKVSPCGVFGQSWQSEEWLQIGAKGWGHQTSGSHEVTTWSFCLERNTHRKLSSFQSWITGPLPWLASLTPGSLPSNLDCELPKPTLPVFWNLKKKKKRALIRVYPFAALLERKQFRQSLRPPWESCALWTLLLTLHSFTYLD